MTSPFEFRELGGKKWFLCRPLIPKTLSLLQIAA